MIKRRDNSLHSSGQHFWICIAQVLKAAGTSDVAQDAAAASLMSSAGRQDLFGGDLHMIGVLVRG